MFLWLSSCIGTKKCLDKLLEENVVKCFVNLSAFKELGCMHVMCFLVAFSKWNTDLEGLVTEALRNFLLGDKSIGQSAVCYATCLHERHTSLSASLKDKPRECVCCLRVILLLETKSLCVCVLIWKEACSYRNSLLGFWRWANIQPIKMKPSGGRWFNVSSNPVSMQFLKNMLQKSNSFWLRLTVSKKITSTHSHPHCVNSCAGDSQLYILTLHTCCWHGTWERVQIAHTWTHSSPI